MNIENFTGKAESYAKGRPGYPKAAIETILGLAPSGAVFADIGAGTGKFTLKLAERGYSVFAVEPNADMRGINGSLTSHRRTTIRCLPTPYMMNILLQ